MKMGALLATFVLVPVSFTFAQSTYQTNCFSPYTTNPNYGETGSVVLQAGDQDWPYNINFISSSKTYPLLEKISLAASTASKLPCTDALNLGNSAHFGSGSNDAYISTSGGDIKLEVSKENYYNKSYSRTNGGITGYSSGTYNIHDYIPPYSASNPYYYFAGFDLLPPFNFTGNKTTDKIASEDRIINEIYKYGKVTIHIDSSNDYYNPFILGLSYDDEAIPVVPVSADIPATNCVHMSGMGDKKIVFMRDTKWNSSVADFLYLVDQAKDIITSNSVYSKYSSKLSFYADLKKIDDSTGSLFYSNLQSSQPSIAASYLKNVSSCTDGTLYVFLVDDIKIPKVTPYAVGFVFPDQLNVVFARQPYATPYSPLSQTNSERKEFAYTLMHEFGHALGQLTDEYPAADDGYEEISSNPYTNCTPDPADAFSYAGFIYGRTDIKGCSMVPTKDGRPMYRPSSTSLMKETHETVNGQLVYQNYNIISCAYLEAALNGEKPIHGSEQKYLSDCQKMSGINQEGYRAMTSAPTALNLSDTSAIPGGTVGGKIK